MLSGGWVLPVPTDGRSSANGGIVSRRHWGHLFAIYHADPITSIPSRHRPLDPNRAVTQGPGDGYRPCFASNTAHPRPSVGLILLFRAQSIIYLPAPQTWRYS